MDIVRWSPFKELWGPLESWRPLRELDALERRMRRMIEESGFVPALVPAADVYETDSEFVVELEAAGFEEKELTVEVMDHALRIKGERTEEKKEETKTLHRHERLERTFERCFELPPDVEPDKVKASFAKGVLEVHAPKVSERKGHKVAIASG